MLGPSLLLSVVIALFAITGSAAGEVREKRGFLDILSSFGGGGGGLGGLLGGGKKTPASRRFGARMTRRESAARCYNGDNNRRFANLCNVGGGSRGTKFNNCRERCARYAYVGINSFLRQSTCSTAGHCECLYCDKRNTGSSGASSNFGTQMIRYEPGRGRCPNSRELAPWRNRGFCLRASGSRPAKLAACQRQCRTRTNRGLYANLKQSTCTSYAGDCECSYCDRRSG